MPTQHLLTVSHLAAAEGHAKAVKLLLGVGASLDAQDRAEQTPLHLAASQGQAPIIRVLAEAGASLEARDDQKATPLIAAARQGRSGALAALPRSGCVRRGAGRLQDDSAPLCGGTW